MKMLLDACNVKQVFGSTTCQFIEKDCLKTWNIYFNAKNHAFDPMIPCLTKTNSTQLGQDIDPSGWNSDMQPVTDTCKILRLDASQRCAKIQECFP